MITFFGDDELDEIKLSNNYIIRIDFSLEEDGYWGWRGRLSGKWRRVRLYDEKENLIAETIGSNPLYKPDVGMLEDFDDMDSDIIY